MDANGWKDTNLFHSAAAWGCRDLKTAAAGAVQAGLFDAD